MLNEITPQPPFTPMAPGGAEVPTEPVQANGTAEGPAPLAPMSQDVVALEPSGAPTSVALPTGWSGATVVATVVGGIVNIAGRLGPPTPERRANQPFSVADHENLAPLMAKLEGLKSFDDASIEGLAELHRPVYADVELQTRAQSAMQDWVWGGKGKAAMIEAFHNVEIAGHEPANDLERTVRDLLDTRTERWGRLAQQEGLTTPDAFHLFRGVDGDYAVKAVVEAWTTGDDQMAIPLYELSSWTTDRKLVGDYFGASPEASVIYEADIPFGKTLADQFVDGGAFVNMAIEQHEVIVATPQDALEIPREHASVGYQGKKYTYAERDALIDAWRQAHPDDVALAAELPRPGMPMRERVAGRRLEAGELFGSARQVARGAANVANVAGAGFSVLDGADQTLRAVTNPDGVDVEQAIIGGAKVLSAALMLEPGAGTVAGTALSAGVLVYENTPALQEEVRSHVRAEVELNTGRVRAAGTLAGGTADAADRGLRGGEEALQILADGGEIGDALSALGQGRQEALATLARAYAEATDQVVRSRQQAGEILAEGDRRAGEAFEQQKTEIWNAWNESEQWVEDRLGDAKAAVTGAVASAIEHPQQAAANTGATLRAAADTAGGAAEAVNGAVEQAERRVAEVRAEVAQRAVGAVAGVIEDPGLALQNTASTIGNGVQLAQDVHAQVESTIHQVELTVWNAEQAIAGAAVAAVGSRVTEIRNDWSPRLERDLANVGRVAGRAVNSAATAASNTAQGATNAVGGAVSSAGNAVTGLIGSLNPFGR